MHASSHGFGSFGIRGLGLSVAAWILAWSIWDKGPQYLGMLLAQADPKATFMSGPRWLRLEMPMFQGCQQGTIAHTHGSLSEIVIKYRSSTGGSAQSM